MENDLIDDNTENQSPDSLTMNLIRWWERLRLPYNLFVIVLQFIFIYVFIGVDHIGGVGDFLAIVIFSLAYLFLMNLCFCLGWGLPLLHYYYFKFKPISKSNRIILLISGCILTIIVTFFTYALIS